MPSEIEHEVPINIKEIVIPPLLSRRKRKTKGLSNGWGSSSDSEDGNDFANFSNSFNVKDEANRDEDLHGVNPKHFEILRESLLHLERSIQWSAVEDSFQGARNKWLSGVQTAKTSSDAAERLEEIYTYIKSDYLTDPDYISNEWLEQLKSDTSFHSVCNCLLELEENLTESTFTENYLNSSQAWKEKLIQIVDNGGENSGSTSQDDGNDDNEDYLLYDGY